MLSMISENDVKVWEHLYDKYAAAMYSIVWQFTDNKELADEIFTAAFLQLKQKNILIKIPYALHPYLLRYTHNYASQYVTKRGISASLNSRAIDLKLIHLLCTQCNSIKDPAVKLDITEAAVIKNLQREFLVLRGKN